METVFVIACGMRIVSAEVLAGVSVFLSLLGLQ
jgi:hypothetical protein